MALLTYEVEVLYPHKGSKYTRSHICRVKASSVAVATTRGVREAMKCPHFRNATGSEFKVIVRNLGRTY